MEGFSVYANPGQEAGIMMALNRPWYELNPKDAFNGLILLEGIDLVDIQPRSKFMMLLLHDV